MGRTDDVSDVLRAAAARLHARHDVPLVFGGLRDDAGVPVTTSAGNLTPDLTTITIKPAAGLGGKAWVSRRPGFVRDYGSSVDITHEYDRQILGERITFLAAVPIVVHEQVRGLLYAGVRGRGQLSPSAMQALVSESRWVANELQVRQEIDRRLALIDPGPPDAVDSGDVERMRAALAQIRAIASQTTDERTRQRLEQVLDDVVRPADQGALTLTPRQLDVLGLVGQGLRNAEIARQLGLGSETVKSYLRAAMGRLGASSRHEAVVAARRAGILP
jgi:DNA-binding CsgD family transcriptional regulator